jgi:glycosyltransferase involved in cell wall biosynthesis
MNKPLISVVMATYNEPSTFITQAIQSILNQTLRDFELLLIDDSTDAETISAIDTLVQADSRIKLIRESKRIGFVRALNIGLKQAQGKYIARMDGDDISLPNRFALQVQYLENHPEISVLGGAVDIIDETGEKISHRNYPLTPLNIKLFSIVHNPLAHPTVMFCKTIIDRNFLYDESFTKAEDLELWLRLTKNGYKISNIKDTLISYRGIIENIANKRMGENFIYNYRARKKNFSWDHPLGCLLSILISRMYTVVPRRIVNIVYSNFHY